MGVLKSEYNYLNNRHYVCRNMILKIIVMLELSLQMMFQTITWSYFY